ncbi:phosphopantetheine-binding protein [Pendulispora brunnea]|uniref:Phosphopantetheine-binding protein n=1 Tax=Pendulispora brunnea TaxID=2905690 RepID=A0ABZ2K858_9BACT
MLNFIADLSAAELDFLRDRLRELDDPIAVVGMACRFPGNVDDPASFWELLQQGKDGISEVPKDRWDIDALYDPDSDAPGKICSRRGGFLACADSFDAEAFGISHEEAALMDPQQRLLLEVCWEALENAGETPTELQGSRTGVFVGLANQGYNRVLEPRDLDAFTATDTLASVASGRLSHAFGFHGPTMSIEAACASSLVAIHLAAESLRRRESDRAIAGGVTLLLQPELQVYFSKLGLLSREGRCKAFDANADGMVRGEGCGLVVLKRYSQAVADGNPVLALVRGSAVQSTGAGKGVAIPNALAERRVLRAALESAKLTPADVGYIETHGTGTWAGDAIELTALSAVFGEPRADGSSCVLGAVKTNIGQLEYAGGVAGVMKVMLAFEHETIPPNLNYTTPHPRVPLEGTPLVIPTESRPWRRGARPRIAGVSAFGLSGALAHVLLEEPPRPSVEPPRASRRVHVLALSARTPDALRAQVARVAAHLEAHPELSAGDVCFSANVGRAHFEHRLAFIGETSAELAGKLRAFLQDPDRDEHADSPHEEHVLARAMAQRYERGVDIDWRSFERPFGHRRVPFPNYPWQHRRFWLHRPTDGVARAIPATAPAIGAQVREAPASERRTLLEEHLTSQLATMLRVGPKDLSLATSLIRLGIDSLMAVELRRRFKADFGFPLTFERLLAGAGIADLVQDLVDHFAANDPGELETIEL